MPQIIGLKSPALGISSHASAPRVMLRVCRSVMSRNLLGVFVHLDSILPLSIIHNTIPVVREMIPHSTRPFKGPKSPSEAIQRSGSHHSASFALRRLLFNPGRRISRESLKSGYLNISLSGSVVRLLAVMPARRSTKVRNSHPDRPQVSC